MLSHPQKSLLDEQQKNSANVNVQVSCFRMDHLQLIGRIWRKTKKTHHRSLHRSSFTLFDHYPASAAPHWTEMTRACLHRALVERRLSGVPMLLLRPALLCQGVPWVCALRRCALLLWRKLGKATAHRPTLQQATLQRSSAESSSTLPQICSCNATRI